MEAAKEELDAFKTSVRSMRWFMTTAVLISVLIILHIWLDKMSLQERQLKYSIANRTQNHITESQKCFSDLAKHLQRKQDELPSVEPESCSVGVIKKSVRESIYEKSRNLNLFLDEYADRQYTIQMTNNTLAKEAAQVRKVPLLGVEVPANDFVTVMAIMSLVFASGVWLNLRAISASLLALRKHANPELLRIARLHTVFIASLDVIRGETIARGLRSFAIWLPFSSIFLATIIGYWQPVSDIVKKDTSTPWAWGKPEDIFIHIGMSVILLFLHLWVANESRHALDEIDETFSSQ